MRVLLVDDHSLFAQSLAIVLSDFPEIEHFSTIKSIDEMETTIEKDNPDIILILSRLVDTFFSRISLTMQPPPKPHSTACVLPWEEGRHWQSRSSGCSSS